jgi:hypothetical protein
LRDLLDFGTCDEPHSLNGRTTSGLEAGAQTASISAVVTRKVTADATVAGRTPAARTRVATGAVLTDTAIVTSGSVPDACYQRLVAAVERAINEADPIRLFEAGAPTDEYSPEINTILPRLAGVQGLSDVTDVLHAEFVRWFDERIAGTREGYEEAARRIWAALLEYRDVVQ